LARELKVKQLKCQSDSQLITGQINWEFQTREPLLQKYYHIAKSLIDKFKKFTITHVPMTANEWADILSKLASTKKVGQHRTLIQENLTSPSWDHSDVFQINTGKNSWMTPIIEYLSNEILQMTRKKQKEFADKHRSTSWTMGSSSGEDSLHRYSNA